MTVIYRGYLKDLSHHVDAPVQYSIVGDGGTLDVNAQMGQTIQISFTGKKSCIACGRKVKKLYQGGYCFPCATSLAECDLCIVKPHECHFHLGTCRDESFGQTHCMIPHYVYLAYSSGVKVGLTRKGRQFKRWIDQGATSAVLVAQVETRKRAGELEMAIAEHLPDKTDWRKMLKQTSTDPDVNLQSVRQEVVARLDESYQSVIVDDDTVHHFEYPRMSGYEPKLSSVSLDKQPVWTGALRGVKGQYLLFDDGVLNVKKHAGYEVEISL